MHLPLLRARAAEADLTLLLDERRAVTGADRADWRRAVIRACRETRRLRKIANTEFAAFCAARAVRKAA